jgi:hypothetical protein
MWAHTSPQTSFPMRLIWEHRRIQKGGRFATKHTLEKIMRALLEPMPGLANLGISPVSDSEYLARAPPAHAEKALALRIFLVVSSRNASEGTPDSVSTIRYPSSAHQPYKTLGEFVAG